jgi:integrase
MAKRQRKRTYGSGEVVPPTVIGGTWGIRVRVKGRRQFQGGFPTREIAERYLSKRHADGTADSLDLPRSTRDGLTLAEHSLKFFRERAITHANAKNDNAIWRKHLEPHFGHLLPTDVDDETIREYVLEKIGALNPGTVRVHVALLSSLFQSVIRSKQAKANPCRGLPDDTMRLMKSNHDPDDTPFLERLEDVERVFRALPEPLNIAFAIGVFAGPRTSELLALRWRALDLQARRIHIRWQVKNGKDVPLKDREPRTVPISDGLLPVLQAWKLKTGGDPNARVIPPMRSDAGAMSRKTPGPILRETLERLGLWREHLEWYQCTRHTFASQWVLNGGSIEKLSKLMGHYSIAVTERYAHLRPDLFTEKDRQTIPLALSVAEGTVVRLSGVKG